MRANRKSRPILLGLFLYVAFCTIAGIYLADTTLHPATRWKDVGAKLWEVPLRT